MAVWHAMTTAPPYWSLTFCNVSAIKWLSESPLYMSWIIFVTFWILHLDWLGLNWHLQKNCIISYNYCFSYCFWLSHWQTGFFLKKKKERKGKKHKVGGLTSAQCLYCSRAWGLWWGTGLSPFRDEAVCPQPGIFRPQDHQIPQKAQVVITNWTFCCM